MRRGALVLICAAALAPAAWAAPPTPQALTHQETALRDAVYRTHPYLAEIIDREDPEWNPTRSFGGWGDVYASYGLCQADPGTKMASEGPGWETNPWVQLRWCVGYADGTYESEANAWSFWEAHGWW